MTSLETASKTALDILTVTIAIELEPEGIKVNAVSPGFSRTNLNGYAGTVTVEEGTRMPENMVRHPFVADGRLKRAAVATCLARMYSNPDRVIADRAH